MEPIEVRIWRNLLSQPPSSDISRSNRCDVIRRQIERLDALNFPWTKDSICDVLLHINSPELEVRENVPLAPFRLTDMPLEIIERIIGHLHSMVRLEAQEIRRAEAPRRPNTPPVLTTIRQFASTSREIYELCRPFLWDRIDCPTSMGGPVDMWPNDILPKHGHHVKDLSMHLANDASLNEEDLPQDLSYDDSIEVNKGSKHQISSWNVIRFLTRCPNLTRLGIEYGYPESEDTDGKTEAFLTRLIPLIAGLKQLKHFQFVDHNDFTPTSDVLPDLLDHLPSLESFICYGLPMAGPNHNVTTLGQRLSQLECLSRLDLEHVLDVGISWCQHPWQNRITNLRIHDCGDRTIQTAHQIIVHIAPSLTHLDLSCKGLEDEARLEWNPQNRFTLPFLEHLRLDSYGHGLLFSFQDCKAIRRIILNPDSVEHVDTLNFLIREHTWPQLNILKLFAYRDRNVLDYIQNLLQGLQDFCDTNNIQADLSPEDYKHTMGFSLQPIS